MKSKLAVIGDARLVEGFQLAGIEHLFPVSSTEFQSTFESLLSKPEFGILVVNESMLGVIDWRLKKKLDLLAYPVIIPLPAPGQKSEEGDAIRSLIKRALGFDLGAKK